MTTIPARLPHDRSPDLANTRPSMFTTQSPEILFFPVLSQDFLTGEEQYTVVRSPPCTLVGKEGVSTTIALPTGRGGGEHRHYKLHDPGPDPTDTHKLGKPLPIAKSVRSSRLTANTFANYPETDLARAISTKLPQRLKNDYNFFASQKSRLARFRHPNKYKRYLPRQRYFGESSKIQSQAPHR